MSVVGGEPNDLGLIGPKATTHPQLVAQALGANPPSASPLFTSKSVLSINLTLPLADLIADKEARAAGDPNAPKPAPRPGAVASSKGETAVEFKVRGNSSLTAYAWPKLSIKLPKQASSPFQGLKSVNLINHTFKLWAESSEHFPWREAAAYAVLEALEIPTLKARAAKVAYIDSSSAVDATTPMVHAGLLVEDDKDAARRRGGKSVDLAAQAVIDPPVVVPLQSVLRMELAERLLGNQDYQLIYEKHGDKEAKLSSLWNFDAVEFEPGTEGGDRRVELLASDFDRSFWVFAPHAPLEKAQLLSWIEQSYWQQPGPTLEALKSVVAKKAAVLKTLSDVPLDGAARLQLKARAKTYFALLTEFLKKPTPPPG